MRNDMFSLIASLSESKLFPTAKSLGKMPAQDASELAYLYICALRIMLADEAAADAARAYCRKASRHANFKSWRSDSNDLYVLLHALDTEDSPLRPSEDTDRFLSRLTLDTVLIRRWLQAEGANGRTENDARRLFVRLDDMFRVKHPSMRSIRRLVGDWPNQRQNVRKLVVTRLLQFLRDRARRGDLLTDFEALARRRGWEIEDACNIEAGDDCGGGDEHGTRPKKAGSRFATLAGFAAGAALGSIKRESASAGATGAANVAMVAGGLGAGFDPDGHERSIYQSPKPKRKSKPLVLRRPPLV